MKSELIADIKKLVADRWAWWSGLSNADRWAWWSGLSDADRRAWWSGLSDAEMEELPVSVLESIKESLENDPKPHGS